MLEGLKRWLSRPNDAAAPADAELRDWVQSRGLAHRNVPGEGFVIDGQQAGTAWRLEWGPSQRPYVSGQELRLRAELGLSGDLQALLLTRRLAEQMESDVFNQYVEGVQTRIDNQTPPEMRWLVMFPKLPASELGPLRERFVALGSSKRWLAQWLDGPLSTALAAQPLADQAPLVLMIGRGRLMLRTALPDADVKPLQAWLRLFEIAMREAQRAAPAAEGPSSALGGASNGSGFGSSALPGDEHRG
jgi:hypothetical protein